MSPKSKAGLTQTDPRTAQLQSIVLTALDDMKAVDVTVLDVHDKTSITDVMVIASGNSERHVKSLAESAIEKAKQAGFTALGSEGLRHGEWVLVDLGDVVLHVMLPTVREFYKLEQLWSVGELEAATEAARGSRSRG